MSRKTCSNHVSAAEGQVMHNLGLETFNSWVTKRAWAVISKDHIHGSSYFLVLAWLLFTGNLVNLPGIVVLRSTRSWVSIYNGKDDTETLEAHHWPEVEVLCCSYSCFLSWRSFSLGGELSDGTCCIYHPWSSYCSRALKVADVKVRLCCDLNLYFYTFISFHRCSFSMLFFPGWHTLTKYNNPLRNVDFLGFFFSHF